MAVVASSGGGKREAGRKEKMKEWKVGRDEKETEGRGGGRRGKGVKRGRWSFG